MIIGIDDEANDRCYSFSFSGIDLNTRWLLFYFYFFLFYFIFICFVFIIICLHRCYNAKLCLFISEFTDSIAHLCTDVMVLHSVILACTDVMVQGIICLFLTLEWIVISHPKGVAGCTFQCFCSMWIVHSDVYGLLYCSCHIVVFPAYYFKVLHRCYVGSVVLVFMYWWWVLLDVPCTFPQKF